MHWNERLAAKLGPVSAISGGSPSAGATRADRLVLWLFAAAVAWIFVLLRYRYSVIGGHPYEIIDGTAPEPFQSRLLIAGLLHIFCWATGTLQQDHTGLYAWVDFASVTASLVVFAALLQRLGSGRLWLLVLIVMLFANYVFAAPEIRIIVAGQESLRRANYITPYDMPALLFMTSGLWAIHASRWRLYYALLVLAILNRETTAILILVFAATEFDRMERRIWAWHITAQLAILVGIRVTLASIFAGHGGEVAAGLVEHDPISGPRVRLFTNILMVTTPAGLPAFGGLWAPFLLASLRLRDRFVRRAAVAAIPPFVLAMALVGNVFELRVFTEILPLMTLVIALGLPEWRPRPTPGY